MFQQPLIFGAYAEGGMVAFVYFDSMSPEEAHTVRDFLRDVLYDPRPEMLVQDGWVGDRLCLVIPVQSDFEPVLRLICHELGKLFHGRRILREYLPYGMGQDLLQQFVPQPRDS